LQKASISFDFSVFPSVRPYARNSVPTGSISIKSDILVFFEKSVKKN